MYQEIDIQSFRCDVINAARTIVRITKKHCIYTAKEW